LILGTLCLNESILEEEIDNGTVVAPPQSSANCLWTQGDVKAKSLPDGMERMNIWGWKWEGDLKLIIFIW
jgi:hypothetical protein